LFVSTNVYNAAHTIDGSYQIKRVPGLNFARQKVIKVFCEREASVIKIHPQG